ncbi:uncharacterized protein VTP21DRAFT_3012 [Calcarisporiella thermophila]|uniref:uncharacterized protein n=1 Tax=Calcarisporiella thermophila TaxID=911321 RepID=UPI0037432E24
MSIFSTFSHTLTALYALNLPEPLPPWQILTILHAFRVAIDFRRLVDSKGVRREIGWLQGLFAVLTAALGGSTTCSIIFGVSPGWLGSNEVLPPYILVYFAVQYLPSFYTLLETIPKAPLEFVLTVADVLCGVDAVTSFGVDGCRTIKDVAPRLSRSLVAMIFCGTVTGCGGGLWFDALRMDEPVWRFGVPREVRTPSIGLFAAFSTTTVYAISSYANLLSVEDGKALASAVMLTIFLSRWASVFLLSNNSSKKTSQDNSIENENEKKKVEGKEE